MEKICEADGRVTDEAKLMRDILEKIEPYVTSGLSRKMQNLLLPMAKQSALKIAMQKSSMIISRQK